MPRDLFARTAKKVLRLLPISARQKYLLRLVANSWARRFVSLVRRDSYSAYARQWNKKSARASPPRQGAVPNGRWEWQDYWYLSRKLAEHEQSRINSIQVSAPDLIRIDTNAAAGVARRLRFFLPEKPKVSIVIPVFGHVATTLECLASIAASRVRCTFEVVIADDASRDATYAVLNEIPGIRIHRNETNLGFVRNCNAAIPLARGEYIVFLNNDVQVGDGWLDHLVEAFQKYPDAGAVGPRICFPSGRLQEAGVAFRYDGGADMIGLNDDPCRACYSYSRRVDYCSGAALMLPRELLRKLGGFSVELVPAYCEDADLCLRVLEQGLEVYYVAAASVIHHLSKTVSSEGGAWKARQVSRNLAKLYERWGEVIDDLSSPKIVAIFFPDFHDSVRGCSEGSPDPISWNDVLTTKPRFPGHYQPRTPADLGAYSLGDPRVHERQVGLARRYHIDAFCYYYRLGFGADPLAVLGGAGGIGGSGFPFCLCISTDIDDWSASLEAQSESIQQLNSYLNAPAYIRVHGRPFLLIDGVPDVARLQRTSNGLRDLFRNLGIGEVFLAMIEGACGTGAVAQPTMYGFDGGVEMPPIGVQELLRLDGRRGSEAPDIEIADYVRTALAYCTRETPGYPRFRSVMVGWDDATRRAAASLCVQNATPGAFQAWLEHVLEHTRRFMHGDERLVFLNAWNGWGYGAYLEPDERYGHSYLEAISNAKAAAKLGWAEGKSLGGWLAGEA